MNPQNFRYSKEHEWVGPVSNGVALIGITEYAEKELGDIVFLDLPPVGSQIQQYKKLGEVESVKAVSDICSPVSGVVLEINPSVMEHPELVNTEPYVGGWLLKVTLADLKELDNLMTAEEYEAWLTQVSTK
ncbi:MAG: glycine cleavage system protein GcvH [Chloroflexi bacterium]|nr:glycine cleavage system protein GcvH [Chloroflexota bacterium]